MPPHLKDIRERQGQPAQERVLQARRDNRCATAGFSDRSKKLLRVKRDLLCGLTACSFEGSNNGTFKPIDDQILPAQPATPCCGWSVSFVPAQAGRRNGTLARWRVETAHS
ncbi:hypothetical protein BLL52_0874 [Rhodoferax antarcticus ANT.BR]|uniref:Uncharacterized protein n=1 Tax=Rhodoferax antarcticus ANT.BR TaxID=1111071 RepID=A0A1Q8YI89_9BURK|nr:hypothetical protein BLL52_0874 [Rhodoferax antarcticus ANT.BR]